MGAMDSSIRQLPDRSSCLPPLFTPCTVPAQVYFLLTDRFAPSPGVAPTPCKLLEWNNGVVSRQYRLRAGFVRSELRDHSRRYPRNPPPSCRTLPLPLPRPHPHVRRDQQIHFSDLMGCAHACAYAGGAGGVLPAGSWAGITGSLDTLQDLGMTAVSSSQL